MNKTVDRKWFIALLLVSTLTMLAHSIVDVFGEISYTDSYENSFGKVYEFEGQCNADFMRTVIMYSSDMKTASFSVQVTDVNTFESKLSINEVTTDFEEAKEIQKNVHKILELYKVC